MQEQDFLYALLSASVGNPERETLLDLIEELCIEVGAEMRIGHMGEAIIEIREGGFVSGVSISPHYKHDQEGIKRTFIKMLVYLEQQKIEHKLRNF